MYPYIYITHANEGESHRASLPLLTRVPGFDPTQHVEAGWQARVNL